MKKDQVYLATKGESSYLNSNLEDWLCKSDSSKENCVNTNSVLMVNNPYNTNRILKENSIQHVVI